MIDNFSDFKNDYDRIVFEKTYINDKGEELNTISFSKEGSNVSIKKIIYIKGVAFKLKRYRKYKASYRCELISEKEID